MTSCADHERLAKRLALSLLACAWLALPVTGKELPRGAPEEAGLSSQKLKHVDESMQALVDRHAIAGVVVMVARRGKVVYAKPFGMRDIQSSKPMQLDTIFRIYSMTKPITTVAAMMLFDEGKFQLDDPVSKYLAEFKGLKVHGPDGQLQQPRREMSIRDLMRHTSGLTYGVFGNSAVDKMYRDTRVMDRSGTLRDMVGKLGKLPLLYQPGTRWHYSVSIDVLGRLVEVISGKPLDVFFKQRIFAPLDMKDTAFHVPAEKLNRFATNYGPNRNGGLKVIDAPVASRYRQRPRWLSGGGGLVSTARDYTRFCQMLLNGGQLDGTRLLREETVRMMVRNQLSAKVMPIAFGQQKRHGVGFGLGFSVRVSQTDWDPAAAVGEYGWGGAASTHFWISPRHDLVVVTLQQYMPFKFVIENTVKPLVYDAVGSTKTSGRSRGTDSILRRESK